MMVGREAGFLLRMTSSKNGEFEVSMFEHVMYNSGQFITTSAEVTPYGGLVGESPLKWP